MGDVAMTVPVVQALVRTYPELMVSVLSRSWARPLFEALGPRVRFIEADVRGRHKGMVGLLRLCAELRRMGFTHVADLHSVLRSHVVRCVLALGGAQVACLDKHRGLRRRLCSMGADAFLRWCGDNDKRCLPTVFKAYTDVVGLAGYSLPPFIFDHFQPLVPDDLPDRRYDAAVIPGAEALGCRVLYGIAPFAAHPGKELPQPLVEQLIDTLLTSQPESGVVLFGRGQREDAVFASWLRRWPERVAVAADVCGDIVDELQLMSRLRVMLSMDSANQHLASLVGTRVVTVWGQTHPAAGFMPWGQQPADSIQADMPCRPCSIFGNSRCRLSGVAPGRFPCIEAITARRVAAAMMARRSSDA